MQNLPLFKPLLREEWRRFRQSATAHRYHPGDTLFYQGNRPLGLFFICGGRVKLVKENRSGRNQIVRTVQAPDLLGDRAFFAGTAYACTAAVMEAAQICFLETRVFWELFERNTALLRRLTQRFAGELGRTEETMNCIATCTISSRMATHLSKYWTHSAGSRTPRIEFDLAESRTEIAQLLATTPEAVSRALAELCAKGLISVQGRHVRILKEERLRLIACLPESVQQAGQPLAFYQADA